MAILVVLLPHLAGAAIPLATTQSLRIPTFPPPYLLRAITCGLLSASYPFLCDHLSSHWWLLQTSLFLLSSSFQQEKKHIAYLDGNFSPFFSGHHASGKKRDRPAHPHHTPA